MIRKFLLCSIMAAASLSATAKVDLAKYHDEIVNLSVDENLQFPEVPTKYVAQAQAEMSKLRERFAHMGFQTDLSEREGLVLMVTIPVSDLFLPNDTLLASFANPKLKNLMHPLRSPDMFKTLIVVHSDDTGSEEYLYTLTRARADAIRQWIADEQLPVDGIVPYGLGFDEPVSNESSRKGRAANRRVEIYFLPGPLMVESLKSSKR
ncbi:MAG: OmpA family protein [Muribaculaceae bacterium]|nr:OmpA family protein [Bacteroides sp.]MDE6222201.1 OmpA family protein [Muribaculaceae bacterium]